MRGWRRSVHRLLLALVALYSLFPIYFMTVQSLKTPEEDVFGSPLVVLRPTLENYAELFEGSATRVRGYVVVPQVPFVVWMLNSIGILGLSVILTLGVAVPAAYALGIRHGQFGAAAARSLSLVPLLVLGVGALFRWFDRQPDGIA